MYQLDVLSDLSERIPYPISGFPLYAGIGSIKLFNKYEAACHWHQDLEFSVMLCGSMRYNINGKTVDIGTGQGVFINSKRLHSHYCIDDADCIYLVITINPAVFSAGARDFFEKKFGIESEDYMTLDGHEAWHGELFDYFKQLYCEVKTVDGNLFKALSTAALICSFAADHISVTLDHQDNAQDWLSVWSMTGFIHQNYEKNITVIDIAKSSAVCRSKCFDLFERYTDCSPNEYLTNYRIQKSCEMLRDTSCTICEIALSNGFQSSSYYAQVFRKKLGLTPTDYRLESNKRRAQYRDN